MGCSQMYVNNIGRSALLAAFVVMGSAGALMSTPVQATPWADSEDLQVRHHLQVLADSGVIQFSASTYPLMWGALLEVMHRVDIRQLTAHERQAYAQIMAVLEFHQEGGYIAGRLHGQSTLGATRGYGQGYDEKAALTLTRDFKTDHSAFRVQTAFRYDREPLPGRNQDPQDVSFAGSYAATIVSGDWLGSWVLSADQLHTWWSPSYESDGMHTVSERPLQALRITRAGATAFESPVLRWMGPWSATAYVGRSERSLGAAASDSSFEESSDQFRRREDGYGARVTINPLKRVQMGARYTGSHLDRTRKNAALDARVTVLSHNYAQVSAYGEVITHQSNTDETFYTAGVDFSMHTPVLFGFVSDASAPMRVFVEHLEHQSREGTVFGMSQFTPSGFGIDTRVRSLRYHHDVYPLRPLLNNVAEREQADVSVYFPLGPSRLIVGTQLWRDTLRVYDNEPGFENGRERRNHVNFFVDWEIRW